MAIHEYSLADKRCLEAIRSFYRGIHGGNAGPGHEDQSSVGLRRPTHRSLQPATYVYGYSQKLNAYISVPVRIHKKKIRYFIYRITVWKLNIFKALDTAYDFQHVLKHGRRFVAERAKSWQRMSRYRLQVRLAMLSYRQTQIRCPRLC